ncbi:MAG: FKBP-type peptidyl-prolyl cis-trans isomerase [Alphaproteobacteria bacterium]|nr:FKBP-type peptidyl-prolyl cis-trans isomerase [Alphaproteobacteria bacterium]
MKKLASVIGICAALGLTACDSNAENKEEVAVVEQEVARSAQNGDTVIINFAGFLGDEQFQGGTAEKYPLVLGSGSFVPGFEEQVVGMKVGEERDINITFPTNYYPELAGKAVVFKVKVLEIQ